MNITSVFYAAYLFFFLTPIAFASDARLDERRAAFLRIERSLLESTADVPFPIDAESLRDYPLYPLLKFQWLDKNLHRDGDIEAYLNDYPELRYAELLRRDWLKRLVNERRWQKFIAHYRPGRDVAMQCRYHWARLQTGHRQEALSAAKRLWTVGRSQPKDCDDLFDALIDSKMIDETLVWKRFALALDNRNVSLARYVMNMLPRSRQPEADFWLKVHQSPDLTTDVSTWNRDYRYIGAIFAHGIERLANSDVETALAVWNRDKQRFQISDEDLDRVERQLGLELAFAKKPGAYHRLSQVRQADKVVREWRVRAALAEFNWHRVLEALAGLHPDEFEQPRWQYWQARALYESGQKQQASTLFERLSADRSLFGFIAADTVKRQPSLASRPLDITKEQIAELERLPVVQFIAELNALGRKHSAQLQWWYWLARLDKKKIEAAAKLAQQWGWTQTAVFTVAKAGYWDDVALRFPLDYLDEVKKQAGRQQLDPAVVLGVIRRESVFDKTARSPAGARGLMQIMPQTGRQIASKLNETWQLDRLFEPSANVRYGTHYFKQMLDRFDGHFALAAAAYNAGPGRVARWLPSGESMPADVWIETIPYKETREYVVSVLGYAIVYQLLMQRDTLKVGDLMKDILPLRLQDAG
ncbi:MAG: lytic transglycosylase Slt [Methylomicrobium sp.]